MRKAGYAPELRERAIWLVREHQSNYGSQWLAIESLQ